MRVLVSAGEASGDRYAAGLVRALARRLPGAEFFGCCGPELRQCGAETVVRAEELAVVGLFEVVRHVPRIYRLYRRVEAAASERRPDLAILTDAPDFHLRLAARLRKLGVPVAYYVAPQVWAWRKGRIRRIREVVDQLLVIFPFEEEYFRQRDLEATFVGHPLGDLARVRAGKGEFCQQHALDPARRIVALLPGSRKGESRRHLPALQDAASRLAAEGVRQFVLPASATTGKAFFDAHWRGPVIRVVEGQAQDCIGHSDLALVASGSATVETAILGTPMVTFYKLAWASYQLARHLVDVPFYSMVNLLAGKAVIPECMQQDCNGRKLAEEALRLLYAENERCRMISELSRVRAMLRSEVPAAERAAAAVCRRFDLRSD